MNNSPLNDNDPSPQVDNDSNQPRTWWMQIKRKINQRRQQRLINKVSRTLSLDSNQQEGLNTLMLGFSKARSSFRHNRRIGRQALLTLVQNESIDVQTLSNQTEAVFLQMQQTTTHLLKEFAAWFDQLSPEQQTKLRYKLQHRRFA